MEHFSKFFNHKALKTSADIKRKLVELVEGNLKEGADEDLLGAINTLLDAAMARSKHEALESIITKANHLQNGVSHLH